MIISTIFGAISVALVGTIAASAALVVGGFISYFLLDKALGAKSRKIIKEAEAEAEVIRKDKILQAKEKFLQLKSDHERDIKERSNKLVSAEN
ncbi:MAG: ribonuclease Y, partial [Marinilabiliales bacterium]